jgi:hypothetical protein
MKKHVLTLVCFFTCLFIACQNPASPDTPAAAGSITGKAVFKNAGDNSGITVSLEKIEVARSVTIISAARGLGTARVLSGYTTTDKDGVYTFDKVAPGTYTIYASSKDSQERAVSINVIVEAGKTVTAPDLNLTPVGKISGTITLDGAKPGISGFLVCAAGTSYMAVTDADGNFVISGVPAADNYLIIVMKGNYTDVWSNAAVTVSGGETTILTPPVLNISSAALDRNNIPCIGEDGYWYIDEINTGVKAQGENGNTPYIKDGNWWIGNHDTGVQAQGPQGPQGPEGSVGPQGPEGPMGPQGPQWEPPQLPETGGSEKLMILQANTYGNANGGAAGFAKSLVELYNNTNAAINLDSGNYYLHIGNATVWTYQIKLTGTIPAKCSFLIVSAADNMDTPRAILPAADQEAAFTLINDNFKAALMKNQSSLSVDNPFDEAGLIADYVDMIGVGTTNGYETQAAGTSRPQPPRRTSLTDTDHNKNDFAQWDARGTNAGNGIANDQLYKYWPRNAAAGAWNPITGLPQIDPAVP